MKNLLIAGVAKSGKSTICEKICEEEKYNHIPFDYITASMKRNYPEWGVKSDVIINDTSKILCTLFKTITDIINDTDEKFIIDCAHIYPHDIVNKLDLNKWKIIFVGYPNIDVDENMDIAQMYKIVSIPALILLKKGEKVDMQIGFQPKDGVVSFIKSHLG